MIQSWCLHKACLRKVVQCACTMHCVPAQGNYIFILIACTRHCLQKATIQTSPNFSACTGRSFLASNRLNANRSMAHPYSEALVVEVQALIDADVAPNVKWQSIQDVFTCEMVSYPVDQADVDSFLVHKCNRQKLGINAFECAKHGLNIKKTGGNAAKLQESVAFELPPSGEDRQEQIAFNERLVAGSQGMLCRVLGMERFVAVGSNHTVQFFKAVKNGCKTTIKEMADADGRLSVQQYTHKDPYLHGLVVRGWNWKILPWQTAIAWPLLPSLVQFTLNASNTAVAQKSELEVAADIFAYAAALGEDDVENYEAGMLQAAEARPACVDYIDVLKRLCAMLDDKGLVVADLDEFAKKHGDTKILGGEFLAAVVDSRFFGGAPNTLVRRAMLAANLVSGKVTDGIARLLQKSDMCSLVRRDMMPKVAEMEGAMKTLSKAAVEIVARSAASDVEVRDACWRFDIRCVLHLCKKGKASLEGRDFKDLAAIQKEFVLESAEFLNQNFKAMDFLPESWRHVVPKDGPSAAPSASRGDPSDPNVVAQKTGGFHEGALVFEKEVGPQTLFELLNLGTTVTVEKFQPLSDGDPLRASMPLSVLVEQWALFKGPRPQALLAEWGEWSWGARSTAHRRISSAFETLCTLQAKFATEQHEVLRFMLFPSEVCSVVAVRPGALRLVPVADHAHLSNVPVKGDAAATVTFSDGAVVYVTPMPKPTTVKHGEWDSASALLPYWWVASTTRQDEANMEFCTESVLGITVQCMRNCYKLCAGQKLVVYKPKPKAIALQGASVVQQPQKQQKPQKRRKTS